jgi:hypothetical protein
MPCAAQMQSRYSYRRAPKFGSGEGAFCCFEEVVRRFHHVRPFCLQAQRRVRPSALQGRLRAQPTAVLEHCPVSTCPLRFHPERRIWRPDALRWGFVPSWTKDLKAAAKSINARAEIVYTSGMFRGPLAARRCTVSASLFLSGARLPAARDPVSSLVRTRHRRPSVASGKGGSRPRAKSSAPSRSAPWPPIKRSASCTIGRPWYSSKRTWRSGWVRNPATWRHRYGPAPCLTVRCGPWWVRY